MLVSVLQSVGLEAHSNFGSFRRQEVFGLTGQLHCPSWSGCLRGNMFLARRLSTFAELFPIQTPAPALLS
jgi:hypothetical protein